MIVFWGSYKSKLDSKGRINFPAKFRKNLNEEGEETLILIRGNEKCISVYPRNAWSQKVEQIKKQVANDREFAVVSRRMMYEASEQTIDKQGRLNLSAALIDYAGLDVDVLIVGYENKIEIWNYSKYGEFVETATPDYLRITQDLDI